MILDQSLNDQLMALAAFRYCLGRQSYIVGACLDWLPSVWDQLNGHTQAVIVRDIVSALMDGSAGSVAIDMPGWKAFAEWAWAGMSPPRRSWLLRDVAHKGKPWPLAVAAGEPRCVCCEAPAIALVSDGTDSGESDWLCENCRR